MHMDELLHRIYYLKSYKGYPCLVSCIQKVKEDESRLCGIREQVYGPVAREHGVKLENLEKNLGTFRKAAWGKAGVSVPAGADRSAGGMRHGSVTEKRSR